MQIRRDGMHIRLLLGPWIRRFLLEHLIAERNLSHNTQTSYRDTMVLLLQFMHAHYKRPLERLLIDDVSPQIVRMFLADLESVRSCSVATRNQRLAAIHSLARFIGLHSPEHLAWGTEVRAIPSKDC
jgi:integrase/recombinase XerD